MVIVLEIDTCVLSLNGNMEPGRVDQRGSSNLVNAADS